MPNKVYVGVFFILLGIAVIFMTRRPNGLDDDQAGFAYVEDESGELQLSDGTRPSGKTPMGTWDGSDEDWLTKWQLTERSGEPVSSEDLKGQPYVAGFFFSTCPSICVRQNSKVQELQEQFKGQDVRFLSISCDPEVDTPEVLTEYAKRYDADPEQWLFLTGTMNYIRRVGAEFFGLGVERRGHPEKFAVIDKNGKPFGFYTWSDEEQFASLVQDLEKLVEAGGAITDADDSETFEDSTEPNSDVTASAADEC